jgi:hypothetical protein
MKNCPIIFCLAFNVGSFVFYYTKKTGVLMCYENVSSHISWLSQTAKCSEHNMNTLYFIDAYGRCLTSCLRHCGPFFVTWSMQCCHNISCMNVSYMHVQNAYIVLFLFFK